MTNAATRKRLCEEVWARPKLGHILRVAGWVDHDRWLELHPFETAMQMSLFDRMENPERRAQLVAGRRAKYDAWAKEQLRSVFCGDRERLLLVPGKLLNTKNPRPKRKRKPCQPKSVSPKQSTAFGRQTRRGRAPTSARRRSASPASACSSTASGTP